MGQYYSKSIKEEDYQDIKCERYTILIKEIQYLKDIIHNHEINTPNAIKKNIYNTDHSNNHKPTRKDWPWENCPAYQNTNVF